MGSEALQRHSKGKKHCKAREEWVEVQNFFKKQSPASSSPQELAEVIDVALACSTRQVSLVKVQTTISEDIPASMEAKQKYFWAVTIGQNDFSNNSAKDIIETLKLCFLTRNFQCGADKIKYMTNWGYRSLYKGSVSTRSE